MTELEKKLKQNLNPEQFEAAMHMNGPAVIIAGAGSGKTHTLINRISHLIDAGVEPSKILMLTFTNKAADEMKDRSAKILQNEKSSEITACTYHKFCNKILRCYGNAIDLGNYEILSPSKYNTMIKFVKKENDIFSNLDNIKDKTIASIFSKSINTMRSIEETIKYEDGYSKYIDYADTLQILKKHVNKKMKQESKVTYDDLLELTNKLMDKPEIARKIANTYEYIMIDEFQDTNDLQEAFLLKLAKYNKNIVVVGDISQAIYGFRGANTKNLQQFSKKIPNTKEIILHRNYRSSQEILDLANNVMNHNVKSWEYHDMTSYNNKHNIKPYLCCPNNSIEETNIIIQIINECHNQKNIPYSDIAVLSRNSMQTALLEQNLIRNEIKYEKYGGQKFFERSCITDMLAYLQLLINNRDMLSLFQVLRLQINIGDATATKIANSVSKCECNLSDYKTSKLKQKQINKLINVLERAKNETRFHAQYAILAEFYRKVRIEEIDNSKKENKNERYDELERDMMYVKKLQEMTYQYENVNDFIDDIILDNNDTNNYLTNDKLTISTIHSAKGLEWKIVIIPDCVEGSFPKNIGPLEYGTNKDEEELRCFYVALTRAKDELYIICPKQINNSHPSIINTNISHYLAYSKKYIDKK